MKQPLVRLVLAGLLAGLLSGCETVPVTGRKQFNLIPRGQEMQLGLSSFQELKQKVPISKDPAANALLQKVGKRIAAACGNDLPDAQWEFVVFESKEANAFCLPGGKIGVYTGILPITRDEAGLATVIGHEVAHASAHHGGERMTEALGLQAVGQLVNVGLAESKYQAALMTAYGLGSQLGVALPHSRGNESEADHIGLVYMAKAGYDPVAAVAFWERFAAYIKQSGGTAQPAFLRTHPQDDTRIARLKQWMPEAKAVYRPGQ